MGERNGYSEDLINYLKGFENFRENAYQLQYKDADGNIVKETWADGSPKYTIGWGLTQYSNGKKVGPNDVITEEQAEKAMRDYLSSKYNAIKRMLPNWELMPQHTKDGIYSMVYRAGSLDNSPNFSANLSNAFADGKMTKDEYLRVLNEMDFTYKDNLLDRAQRNAALLGGLYDYADNGSINYATTHISPYHDFNKLMGQSGSKWSKQWKDVTSNSNPNMVKSTPRPAAQPTGFFALKNPYSYSQPYEVKSGEALSVIAKNHGVTLNDILKANPQIKHPDQIYAGQQIEIPINNSQQQSDKIDYSNPMFYIQPIGYFKYTR